MRSLAAAVKAQFAMSASDPNDVFTVLSVPLYAVILLAIVKEAGRHDLATYSIVAPVLLGFWAMGLNVASDLLQRDRWHQIIEPLVAAPANFGVVMTGRIAAVTCIGLFGFVEVLLVAWFGFGVRFTLYHPAVFALTTMATAFASVASSLVMSTTFALVRSPRMLQNSLTYPFYLLGGIMVPTTYLPSWMQVVSKAVFLSWSADLLRDSFVAATPKDVATRLAIISALGVLTFVGGWLLLDRVIDRLRHTGDLGLA